MVQQIAHLMIRIVTNLQDMMIILDMDRIPRTVLLKVIGLLMSVSVNLLTLLL